MLKLTVEGKTAEELVSSLLAAANTLSSGAGLVSVADKQENKKETDKDAVKTDEQLPSEPEQTSADDTKPTGRRGARRGADKADDSDAGKAEETAGKGRRSRAAKTDDLVNDNEEQAALRAQIVVDLQDLADVEEAHGEVQDALKRVGAKSVKEIASASLGDFDAMIQPLITKYFE